MATVIGPTPPGTGVMKPAFSFTPTKKFKQLIFYKLPDLDQEWQVYLCLTFYLSGTKLHTAS